MPGLLSGKTLRTGGSGEFIDLKGAMPQLPTSPSTSTGFTVVTDDKLRTTYRSSLGNLEFNSSTIWSNIAGQPIQLIGTDTLAVIVSGGTVTTSTNTGALVVQGGIGVWGNVHIGGDLVTVMFTATTATVTNLHVIGINESTGTTSGALVVDGGVGIGKNLNVGSTLTAVSALITGKTISSNTSSGALVVAGGVGIGQNLIVGSTLIVNSSATISTDLTVNRDVNINGELVVDGLGSVTLSPQAASVNIQPTAGGSITIQPSLTGSIEDMVIGAAVPRDSYFLNSHANNFIGLATTSTNLEKGKLGSIPYQSNTGTTEFIDIGLPDTVLVSNGTTATWKSASGFATSTSTYANEIFVNTTTVETSFHVLLSTATNTYGTVVEDDGLSYDTTGLGTLITPNLTVTNTATVIGSVYSQDGGVDENYLLYTPRVTITTSTPLFPRVGDFWIDPTYGVELQYVNDGGNKFWVQFTGL